MNPSTDLKNVDEALKESPEVAVLTSGISMRPMLREHKDVVIIKRVDKTLRRNDVPLYTRAGTDKLVLHRILKVTPDCFIIRGDNLLYKEYVEKERIVGVLKAFYREGKYYDCEKSLKYKLYVLYNRLSFPCRWLWRLKLKPFLSKVKHLIIK